MSEEVKIRKRYKCANCGFVFEDLGEYVECPKCGTNAVDLIKYSKSEQFKVDDSEIKKLFNHAYFGGFKFGV